MVPEAERGAWNRPLPPLRPAAARSGSITAIRLLVDCRQRGFAIRGRRVLGFFPRSAEAATELRQRHVRAAARSPSSHRRPAPRFRRSSR